ncbi:hypothetical protein ACFLZP_04615 [Patescibacteria group bacterium]
MNKKSVINQSPQQESSDTPQKKKVSTPMMSLALIMFLFGGIGGYLIGSSKTKQISQTDPTSPSLSDTWQKPTATPSKEKPNETICKDQETYTSKNLNIEFVCPLNAKVAEAEKAISISPPTKATGVELMGILYRHTLRIQILNKGEIAHQLMTINDFISMKVGERHVRPGSEDIDPKVPDNIRNSLTRLPDQTVLGKKAYVYEDQYPYEGTPFVIYILPFDNYYYYIFFNSSGLDKEGRALLNEVDEQAFQALNQILSSLKFSDQSDKTANWETYRNPRQQYQLSYPQEWTLSENTSVRQKDGQKQDIVTIDVRGVTPRVEIDSNSQLNLSIADIDQKPKSTIKINNLDTFSEVKYDEGGGEFTNHYFVQNGKTYTITTISYPDSDLQEIKNPEGIFEQILSTFKFVE